MFTVQYELSNHDTCQFLSFVFNWYTSSSGRTRKQCAHKDIFMHEMHDIVALRHHSTHATAANTKQLFTSVKANIVGDRRYILQNSRSAAT